MMQDAQTRLLRIAVAAGVVIDTLAVLPTRLRTRVQVDHWAARDTEAYSPHFQEVLCQSSFPTESF